MNDSDKKLMEKFRKGCIKGKSENLMIKGKGIYSQGDIKNVIAERFNKQGIDYLYDSNKFGKVVECHKKFVLKELKGVVLHIIDCEIENPYNTCKICHGNNPLHQLIENNERIKELVMKEEAVKKEYKKEIKWLQEQNELLKPLVILGEL